MGLDVVVQRAWHAPQRVEVMIVTAVEDSTVVEVEIVIFCRLLHE